MPMVSIVWCANVLQEKSPDTRPLMTSSLGLSSLQICRLQRSRTASQYPTKTKQDGLTHLPWQEGKPLSRDVTAICSLAVSYFSGYFPGELAASRKCEKYANLPNSYIFQHLAFENLGTLNSSAVRCSHFCTYGRKISTKSNELRESIFLFKRLAITFHRFNSVFLRESFVCDLDK